MEISDMFIQLGEAAKELQKEMTLEEAIDLIDKISCLAKKAIEEWDEIFVLTEKGYTKTPDSVKLEREIGKPAKHFEKSVPISWYENGLVTTDYIWITKWQSRIWGWWDA